jgi:hypothetical protein
MLIRACSLVASVVFAVALFAGPASASVRVSARLPAVALARATVVVHGRVWGRRRSGLRVVVQRRRGGRWRLGGRSRRLDGARFSLRWRAPRRAGVVRLRVAVVAGSPARPVAVSRGRRLAVSATRVLLAGRVVAAPPSGRAGVVRYSGRVSAPVGGFVAADAGPATPAGLLGRVVSWRRVAGSTLVAIKPASLLDAVPEGSISLGPASAGVARAAGARFRGFRSALNCSAGARAEVVGSLAVRLIPAFKLRWSLGGVDQAEAKVTLRGDADLLASIGGAGSCSLPETSVASWDAPPLRFFAGPIPVVVVPRTTLFVAGEASATAAVEAGVHGSLSATAGLSYDGDVHPIGSFTHSFAYSPPTARVTGSVGARVIPAVTFLLYGQAGPRFDLSAGLRLGAEAGADPWWTLVAPVELRAGLEVPHVPDLAIPQRAVFSRTFPIAQADPGGDPTPVPGPAPAAGDGSERARISWDTAATDVDLHVWDAAGDHAWFRDPAAIPGAELSEDDRYGFGPEHFRELSGGGRALTYGLCYFDDTGSGPTSVSVRVTDPGGGVRELTRTLAREGDHVLLGSSPAGSAYVPPEGWCRP